RWDLVDHSDAAYLKAATASFDLLQNAVAEAVPSITDPLHIRHAAKSIWAMVHGFVTLSMIEGEEATARLAFSIRALLSGMSGE
ncbi:MAG: TetR-like C-terminal domain-containing protein, partial [Pseudomonadota bacterium]